MLTGQARRRCPSSLDLHIQPKRRRSQLVRHPNAIARSGFTLIEILMAIIVMALIMTIAIPSYQSFVTRARNAQAVADIAMIDMHIERYRTRNFSLPPNLAALGASIPLDPWGNAYRYLNIQAGGPGVIGASRKNRNMVPINSDYDLYSMGADGKTATPLPSKPARDDIVRARNGGFIGLAQDF